jgi:pyruvate/2-oxoglutarate/acetoin dehydrogenase E1 component
MYYFEELKKSMRYLAKNKKTIFIGQAVEYPGTAMTNTLKNINRKKLYEFPVAEEMQMGVSIGLSLNGFLPITLYPRWNFLILAMNQLVNHLDKIEDLSNGEYKPKVIIRTSVGSSRPLNPQKQHVGNFSSAFRKILKNIDVVELKEPKQIFPAYKNALSPTNSKSTLIVEFGDFYNEK